MRAIAELYQGNAHSCQYWDLAPFQRHGLEETVSWRRVTLLRETRSGAVNWNRFLTPLFGKRVRSR